MREQTPMRMWFWVVLAAAAVGLDPLAIAQETQPTAPEECDRSTMTAGERFAQDMSEFIKQTKNPTPWLSWGADARLREIFSPNLLLNDEDRHFQRYRFRLWTTIKPVKDFDVNFRIVYEPRHFCEPERKALVRDAAIIDSWTTNEAIIDQLNVRWDKVCGMPLTLTVGRQDIILGNGWLVLDGTPLDGSRTIFFDAARATLEMEQINTKADLIFICNQADSDYYYEPVCDQDFHNIEQDEQGAILYVTNKSLPKTQIDGYFMYKHDERVLRFPVDGVAPWQQGSNGDIYAFGARVAGDIDDNWRYRAEFAQEFGRKNGQALCALGLNSQLAYFMKDKLNNNFRFAYEYLSGDKETTESTSEQFDQLWGRWPQFSELFVYPVALENRPGEVTNLHRLGVGWSCNPCPKLELCTDYNLLFADKTSFSDRTIGGEGAFSDKGYFRGQLASVLLKYTITENVKGHLLGEFFFPGNYYSNNFNETAAFLRYEIIFSW